MDTFWTLGQVGEKDQKTATSEVFENKVVV